jgi:two-component system CheB/CheR fusion protein
VQAEADRVAIRQYAPPGVVINDAADILQVTGRPAPYIELSQGLASLNLFKLAHPEIVSDLRYLVNLARKQNRAARKDNLILKKNGSRRDFGIRVVPLRVIPPSQEHYFSVFFEDTPGAPPASSKTKQRVKTLVNRQHRIEDPQRTAEDWRYQQGLIEEYEATQEELVSSNEELQSTNEELQSTNEELETAKEELQSANEEMTTINDELQTRNSDMSLLSNDLTNLLSSVNIPIVMVGPDAKIRRFTPKASQTLNLLPGDIGRPISDIKPAIQTPDLDDLVLDVMSTLSMKEFETQDKDGAWYRLQARPYRTSDNRIDGAVIALMDITDLKRSSAAMQIAHDDAKTIVDTMPIAMLIIDANRRIQMANQAFVNMFNIQLSDIQGKSIFELDGGLWNISSVSAMLETVLVQGTPVRDLEIEQDFPRAGHKDMVLHATATRLIGSGNGTATALIAIEDVTMRRQAADQLRYTEEKYRHLLEKANDGILIVDEEGKIEFANHSLETMFGYSAGELEDGNYEMLIPDEKRAAHLKHHGAFMRQPEARNMGRGVDLIGKRKNGTIFPVEISLSPVVVKSKVVVTAIVRDISARRKLETERHDLLIRETEARQEAERISLVKDEFLATLSHELRTPMTTILSWVQTLRLGQADPEKTKRALTVIEKSAKDQGQLIDDLLDVSRIQAGKVFLELREINPRDCIVAALDSVRSGAENKSITIQTELDSSECAIMADPSRVEQVFRNLFDNAIKFTPPGGKITVRSKLKKDEKRVEIQVEDTGKGIRPEFLPLLFTRFSQEDSTTKRAFGGLGLGLSIVRNLVEMHKGTIAAYSPGEGKGAVFTVALPCAESRFLHRDSHKTSQFLVATPQADERLSNLSGLRVLIIDDQDDTREGFLRILQAAGAQVETSASAQAGLGALARFRPDVALCDIAMPEEDGLSFIRKVRNMEPGKSGKAQVIALTAYASAADARKALDAGFDAHVAKPVDAIELSRLIAKLARRGKKRR